MQTPNSKKASFKFGFSGMNPFEDPTLLKDGQYRYALNVCSNQDGTISSRNGIALMGVPDPSYPTCYNIRKLTVVKGEEPNVPGNFYFPTSLYNPRYLGMLGSTRDIVRTSNYTSGTLVATNVDTINLTGAPYVASGHWEMADYSGGETGQAWAYFACPNAMLKDSGAAPFGTLQMWGILPAGGVAMAAIIFPGLGLLDGGTNASPNNSQPYDWVYTYEQTATGNEGNPSQFMLSTSAAVVVAGGVSCSSQPLAIHLGVAQVICWGFTPPSGSNPIGLIKLYRRGGILTDGIFRLVGTQPNPGSGAYATFADNIPDVNLVYNDQVSFFNNPPVTSTVPSPINATTNAIPASTGATPFPTITLITGSFAGVRRGTLVSINDPNASETVIVTGTPTSSSFQAFFQFAHPSGTPIQVAAITGQPCNLTASISGADAVLVAGDPNNPHILYKSANGSPEYFPIGTDAAGAVTQLGVGTPSNGIVNFTEFRGQVLCMNVSSLFEVAIIAGSLIGPAKVAEKGLCCQDGWCKTPDEVWFLATDGVYSWDGGQCHWRSRDIDPVFHGQEYNGIQPISYNPATLLSCRMVYHRGLIRMLYTDITGSVQEIVCEPRSAGRWCLYQENYQSFETPLLPLTAMYDEPDTDVLIVSVSESGALFGIADSIVVDEVGVFPNPNFTSDWYTNQSNPFSGTLIPWSLQLPWFDLGSPDTLKLFEEAFLDIDPQLYNGVYPVFSSSISVYLYLNYDPNTIVDQFILTIPAGTSLAGRTLLSLLPQLAPVSGATYQSYGREARAISFGISGEAYPVPATLYRLVLQYEEIGQLTAGGSMDWMDLGGKTDKRLYQMSVTFDTNGVNQQIVLESMVGRDGVTVGTPQVFTLSNPVVLGSGKCLKVFPLADNTIVKLVRVRPYTAAQSGRSANIFFRVLDVSFPSIETYPPDVVTFTEPENGGYEYLKYLNQVELEVNTNGVAVMVQVQADGNNIGPPFPVNTTVFARQASITMPTGLTGFWWRLFVDPTQSAIANGSGMFQLFRKHFAFQQADPGEVVHTGDWDSLGWDWDKNLRSVVIEWDDTGGVTVTLQLDTLSGIDGNTITQNVAQFTISGGRSQRVFALPVDTIAKKIRIYPVGGVPITYKQWKYRFQPDTDFDKYPPDVCFFTPWKDAQSNNDKNPTWIDIDMDTQGVPCSVILQNEAGTALTFSHTGTVDNRKNTYPIPADIFARMWRLLPTAGTNGKSQLFNWNFDRWQPVPNTSPIDPPLVILWVPWNDLGWQFDKVARNLVLEINTNGIACSVQPQADGVNMGPPFNITTTYTQRQVILPFESNLIGKLWRLIFTPGAGFPEEGVFGYAQLWNWGIEAINEPPAVSYWDSYEITFGVPWFKFLKQVWWMYACPDTVTLNFFVAGDAPFYSVTLPAHPDRDTERFYLPTAVEEVLNKTKVSRITMTSTGLFKFYPDSSAIEIMIFGQDRHNGYAKMTVSEFIKFQTGAGS